MNPNRSNGIPRWVSVLALAALGYTLAGCGAARSKEPVGRRPAMAKELSLEGVWRDAEGRPVFLRWLDTEEARLELATVGTNPSGFVLNRSEVLVRAEGDALLANLRAVSPDPEPDYTFGRLTVTDGALVFHVATAAGMRKLALEGVVGAEITTNSAGQPDESWSVRVTNGFPALAETLAAPDGHRHLDTANPFVLMRLRDELD